MKNIHAEIITIGDEILYGQIADTNSQFISGELDTIGVKVVRITSIGDEEDTILAALSEAEQRADLILMTGGLGPTKDDITKKTLCNFFDTELVIDEKVLQMVTEFFEKRGRQMLESNRQQAALPATCEPIYNRLGTAPGMWFEKGGKVFISMPGVPQEMKILMTESLIPKIQTHFQTPVIYHKVIKTFGKGESFLAEVIGEWADALPPHIKLAYLPSWGEVKLRLTGIGEKLADIQAEIAQQVEKVSPLIQKYIYGFDKDELEAIIGQVLVDHQKTISTAESCTGGYIAHLFTKIPGSSRYFAGGIVSYSNEIKMHQLGVQEKTLMAHGAVSEATVREMAENVRTRYQTDIGVASSGVAGPDGGSAEKPVGTVWIALADEQGTYARKLMLTNDRLININLTAKIVLDLVRKRLLGLIDNN